MLIVVCEQKEVFYCLGIHDPEYKDVLTNEDWFQAENMCVFLMILLKTVNLFVEERPPLAHEFFHDVLWILQELKSKAASEDDPFVRNLARVLQEKLLSYWRDAFLVLAVSVAMDPRFKMKLVEFCFAKIFGEEAPDYTRMVDEGIHGLFDEYIMEITSQQMKSELDEYLDESLVPRMQQLDVISWWKLNRIKYPTLSKMALDMLSIPLSSAGPLWYRK